MTVSFAPLRMTPARLLVLRLSALGDVIHTIPAVTALRDALPDTRISWVVEAPYRELVELVAGVEAIPVRLRKWSRAPMQSRGDMRAAMQAMRGADAAVDFQGLIKSAAIAALSRARTRYGFDVDAIREKAALLFINERVRVDTTRHVIDQNLELAQAVAGQALPVGQAILPVRTGRIAGPTWSAFPQTVPGAASVVLLPGAGKANKQWPVERFRELARRYEDHVIAWGPAEKELAEAIGGRLAPPTNIRELAYLLARAKVVVAGDTGPLHLAAALGTRVVGLYGPTNPRRNGPYGQLHRVVSHFESSKSMESITVSEVVHRIDEALST
jgi:lipopolysaccharide heptosyltransferase I